MNHETKKQSCRGYEVCHPYPQIFRGYPYRNALQLTRIRITLNNRKYKARTHGRDNLTYRTM